MGKYICTTLVLLVMVISDIFTFNLSPVANYQFKPPSATPGTSLFGLSMVLNKNESVRKDFSVPTVILRNIN